jgi:hypothetical protein
MKLRVGQTLSSPVDTTTVIVVRAPSADIELTCAGVPMLNGKSGGTEPEGTADLAQMGGSQLGKRYADDDLGLELLCTKAGAGTLAANGKAVPLRDAKPLPTSD